MANTTRSSIPPAELGNFLFADLDIEPNGLPLSVLSALARMGLDPWQEAKEMAALSRTAAVTRLARIIIALPGTPRSNADANELASQLVTLLPGRSPASADFKPRAVKATRYQTATFVLLGFMFTWIMFNLSAHQQNTAKDKTGLQFLSNQSTASKTP